VTNQQPDIVPVILSGGSGTRLWPASRAQQPKQLLPLLGRRSLIQQTVDRLGAVPGVVAPVVVTNETHATAIGRALASSHLGDATIVLEPMGRNTAPAVAVAALEVLATRGDAMLLVLPSDHAIGDEAAFAEAVASAADIAVEGNLVTFGITATSPETGYGYIRRGEPLAVGGFRVDEFKEKPDLATAQHYVSSGSYSWNSGMFLFSASAYLAELERFRPAMARGARAAHAGAIRSGTIISLDPDTFAACEADSIDYAVMEQTDHAAVLPIDPDWSDVGSWSSLWEISPHDDDGNTLVGDVTSIDTTDSYVRSSDRLVVTAGVTGMIVVDTPDALLVTTTGAAQDVKRAVDDLAASGRTEVRTDGTTFADWGITMPLGRGIGYDALMVRIDPHALCVLPEAPGAVRHLRPIVGSGRFTIDDVETGILLGRAVPVSEGAQVGIVNDGDDVLMVVVVSVDTDMDGRAVDAEMARRSDAWSW
jgi:mannose-1-phosphate guanylyltransferase/mannose-6-phosphate isomerase